MPSLYAISVPVFIRHLTTLKYLLSKATTQFPSAEEQAKLIATRLYHDQGALDFQIQRISDTSKGFAIRVGGVAPVPLADDEKSIEDLQTRLQKTIDILKGVKEEDVSGKEEAQVVMKTGAGERVFTGEEYALTFAIPNFYFHYTTAYDILRSYGVSVGKQDFLGANTPK